MKLATLLMLLAFFQPNVHQNQPPPNKTHIPPITANKEDTSGCVKDKYGWWVIEPDGSIGFSKVSCTQAEIAGSLAKPPVMQHGFWTDGMPLYWSRIDLTKPKN